MIKHVKNVRFAIAKLAFWHEALLCGIGHQNGWKKSRPFWALTKLWFTWYGLGGYNVVNPPVNTAQIRCDGMQHMLKHLILPCVFTSKIKVALFYMIFALHLNVAWKWGTLTVSMFFCVFLNLSCMIQRDHLQRSINNVINIPRTIIHPTPPHAPPHPALSRSMIQRDHLQRSNNRCAVIGEPGSPRVYLYIRIHASLQKRILRTPGPCTFTYLKWYVYIHERARRYIFLYTHPCLLVQTCIWWLQRRRTWQIVNNIMFKQIQNRF